MKNQGKNLTKNKQFKAKIINKQIQVRRYPDNYNTR